MAQDPIFPPNEPIYAPNAVEAAREALDSVTREILDRDRARLTQASLAATFTLSQELGLSEGVHAELQVAVVERLAMLPPTHHAYMNQLLGGIATTLAGQKIDRPALASKKDDRLLQTEAQRPFVDAKIAVVSGGLQISESAHTNGNGTTPDNSDETYRPHQSDNVIASIDSETATSELPQGDSSVEATSAPTNIDTDSSEKNSLVETYDESDIIKLPDGIRLYEHKTIPRNMRNFLAQIFVENTEALGQLSPKAMSILMWTVMQFYNQTQIPQATVKRKAAQTERLDLYVGLSGPIVSSLELCSKLSITAPSLYTGINRVKDSLREKIADTADDMIRRAIITAKFAPGEDVFRRLNTSVGSEPNASAGHTGQQNGSESVLTNPNGLDNESSAKEPSELLGDDIELKPLHRHWKVPASMRNFLLGTFPGELSDRILELEPEQASLLTDALLTEYKDIVVAGLSDERRTERIRRVELWTGLRTEAENQVRIAQRYAVEPTQIKNSVESVIRLIEKRLPKPKLKEMLKSVTISTERRAATSSANR